MRDVWLEIADAKTDGSDQATLELRWRVRADRGSARLTFVSPVTASIAERMLRDVQRFRSWHPSEHDRALSLERALLTLGRALGSALVEPNYSLLTFRECLERENNISALHVVVRTDQPALAAVPWELMILPDSQYVLAAAAAAFVRAPLCDHELPPKELALGAGPEHALGYLRLDGCASRPELHLEDLWKAQTWQSALRVGLGPAPFWSSALPEPGEHSWQIVHWTGAITRDGAELRVSLRDARAAEQTVAARQLFSAARALGVELLILEPTLGGELLDELASAALQAEIPNALAIREHHGQAWPSRWLHHLLECLGDGLGLQQAVVETRKRMQRARIDALQGQPELPHAQACSHVLLHYSVRDVVFFASAQPRAPEYARAHPGLFGVERLTRAPELGDVAALSLFDALAVHGAVLVYAPHGGGLTHSLQRAASLSLVTGSVQRAYCWDFARDLYTVQDVLEMVAGVCGETDPKQVSEQNVLASLAEQRALFVFDNLDLLLQESASAIEELLALVRRVHRAGGLCLLGTHQALAPSGLPTVELPAISEHDCVAVGASHRLNLRELAPTFLQLIEQLQGLPLLVQRVLADCSPSNVGERLREASIHYGVGYERAQLVERFYAWRFTRLEPHWRRLLCAWAPLQGLYLQLLIIAVDRPGSEPVRAGDELWRALAVPAAASCAGAIKELQQAGFVVEGNAGVCLDGAALRFVRERDTEPVSEATRSALASALCTGVLRLLSQRGSGIPEPLKRHLVEHRAQLREQIVTTLAAGETILATRTFLVLFALLQEAKLTHESAAWAASVLESAGPSLYESGLPQLETAWLSVAQRVPATHYRALLEDGVRHFSKALLSGAMNARPAQRAHLPLVVQFLEGFYDQTGDVARYRDVARSAVEFYRANNHKPLLLQQLTALAAAEHVLGNSVERDRLEQELLHSHAYDESRESTELRTGTLARIARMRIARQDDDGAEVVLKQLEQVHAPSATDPFVLHCHGDLALMRQQWELAAQYFCTLWQAALRGTKGIDIDLTAHRLSELRNELGNERFAALYTQHAGDDIPTPEALGVANNPTATRRQTAHPA